MIIDYDIRLKVRARDRNKCRICGAGHKLESHHVISKAHGGSDHIDNLITLCRKCHKKIHEEQPFKAEKRYLEAWVF